MKLHDILTPLAGQQVTYGTTLYTLSEVGDDYIALTHTSDPGIENVVYIPYTGLSTFSVYSNHGAVSIKVHSQRQQV
jgi:hypothetical protein